MLKQADLIGGETIAIDSFKVRGQNSLKNNYNEKKINRNLDYIDARIGEFLQTINQADRQELSCMISVQKQRRQKYVDNRKKLNNCGQE